MLTMDILSRFSLADTHRQASILKDVGVETECADVLLGHLRGNHPERWSALLARMPELGEVA